jgi:molecular chaperone GrpE
MSEERDDERTADSDAEGGQHPGGRQRGEPEARADDSTAAARLQDAEDRLLRTQAELDNFRKRSRREYEDAQRYREMDLLRDILPVLDNVLRALEAADRTADVEGLIEVLERKYQRKRAPYSDLLLAKQMLSELPR